MMNYVKDDNVRKDKMATTRGVWNKKTIVLSQHQINRGRKLKYPYDVLILRTIHDINHIDIRNV